MADALRVLIARREELGEAFAAKPFRGAVDLSGGLCMTPLTGALIAAIDTRVDPGAWIGETAAMMSRRSPVVFAEVATGESGPAQAAVAWTGGKRVYAGRDGIPGLVPAEETGPPGGVPLDRALEAAFGLGAADGRSPSQEAGLPRWRSNEQLQAALRKHTAPENREPLPGAAPAPPPLVLRFSYDAALLDAAMAAGGRRVLARLHGWRRHWPLIIGLTAGAAMVALGFVAPLVGLEIDVLSGGVGILIGAALLPLMIRGSQRSIHAMVMETPVMRAPMVVELRAEGVLASNAISETALTWEAVDDLIDLGRGFGLLSGAVVIPLPRAAFPEGLDRAMLRARIAAWRGKP